MDALNRRVPLLLLAVVLAFAFVQTQIGFTGEVPTWRVVFYLIGLACTVVAGALLVAAVAPETVFVLTPEQRERCLFFALALVVAALVVTGVLRGYDAYWVNAHPNG